MYTMMNVCIENLPRMTEAQTQEAAVAWDRLLGPPPVTLPHLWKSTLTFVVL